MAAALHASTKPSPGPTAASPQKGSEHRVSKATRGNVSLRFPGPASLPASEPGRAFPNTQILIQGWRLPFSGSGAELQESVFSYPSRPPR